MPLILVKVKDTVQCPVTPTDVHATEVLREQDVKLVKNGIDVRKPVFRVSESEIQTILLNYRDYLENWNFARSKSRYTDPHFQRKMFQGPISSIKFVRYILNCAYVDF